MTALVQMPPSFAVGYSADLRLLDAETHSDSALRKSPEQGFDFGDLLVRQLGTPVLRPSARRAKAFVVRVLRVLARRAPLKVFDAVVRLVAVDVIDLMQRRRGGPQKSLDNHPMDWAKRLLTLKAERRPQVTPTDRPEPKHALSDYPHIRGIFSARPAWDPALHRSYPPKIRDFVRVLEAADGPPNLFHLPRRSSDTLRCNCLAIAAQPEIQGEP